MMELNTFIEQELEKRMLECDACKTCAFFHMNNGLVDPKIKCYCFFAYDCLIGHKHRYILKDPEITKIDKDCNDCEFHHNKDPRFGPICSNTCLAAGKINWQPRIKEE